MLQIDTINAYNVYMRSANSKTPAAFKHQLNWRPWFDNLSWFAKTADSNVLKEATRRRDAFVKANTPPPGKVVNEKGKELVMAAPQRLTVKKGSPKSQNVVDLQNILGLKPADGIFGNNTHNSVVAFQKKNGLKPDGIVGPATWEKLLGKQVYVQAAVQQSKLVDAVKAAPAPSNVKVAPGKPQQSTSTSLLRRGSVGQAVKDWQKNYLGIANPDGIFGPETERLTKDWQVKHGLMGDGIVGPGTKAAALVAGKTKPKPQTTAERIFSAPSDALKAVADSVSSAADSVSTPAKAVQTIKNAPKKVSQSIARTVGSVTPGPIKKWPVWAQVATTFVAGMIGVGAYNKFTKKT